MLFESRLLIRIIAVYLSRYILSDHLFKDATVSSIPELPLNENLQVKKLHNLCATFKVARTCFSSVKYGKSFQANFIAITWLPLFFEIKVGKYFFLFVKSQQGPNSQYQTFLYEIYLQLRNKVLGDFKTIRFTSR